MRSATGFPPREILAIAAPGIEDILAAELARIGWPDPRAVQGGAVCVGGAREVWRACLSSRVATGLRVRVGRAQAQSLESLAQGIARLPWGPILGPRSEPRIEVTTQGSPMRRRDAIARKAGLAIRDALRGPHLPDAGPVRGRPPLPATVHLRIVGEQVEASIDPVGGALWQRGYRARGGAAPLRENLAAALLLALGWEPTEALVDPFAGSGTFPIEAAAMARGLAPGLGRSFAFESWPSHDARAWRRVREAARTRPAQSAAAIQGSDADARALELARANASAAGVAAVLCWQQARVDALTAPPGPPGLVIGNPPWGRRLGQDVGGVYAALGRVLRERFRGWRVGLLCPDPGLIRLVRLPLAPRLEVPIGGARVALWHGRVPEEPPSGR